jgi:hypothetical protein
LRAPVDNSTSPINPPRVRLNIGVCCLNYLSHFSSQEHAAIRLVRHVLSYWVIYAGLGIWVWYANRDQSSATTESASVKPRAAAVAKRPAYVRPAAAPNGAPWPLTDGYAAGYGVYAGGGLSSLTVDNTQNDSDVFVKLTSNDVGVPTPVRHFFIKRGSQFRAENIQAGRYDIRYRDLNSGGLSRSDPFELTQTPTYNGIEFSNMTITLYKVRNGNMQTHSLEESDF